MRNKKFIWLFPAILLMSVLLFSFKGSRDFKLVKNMEIFSNMLRELSYYYVDETDPEKLITTGMRSMLKTLDPYTVFISEDEMDEFRFTTTGQYGGVGSLIRKKGEYILITNVYKDFPADRAGIKAGDLLVSIDGRSIKGKSSTEVSDLLKGAPGSGLQIGVKRYGNKEILEFKIERQEIDVDNVPYYGMLNKGTAYIRLSNFRVGAADEIRKALKELKQEEGASSLVLDLRGNPGGLLIEAVEVSNIFVDKGEEIVHTRGKIEEYEQSYKAAKQPLDLDIPLVLLVDRGSASSSEIVAGSIQDLDRGVIIGERTYGKGLVQTSRPLGYNTQLKLTTAKYYIPSGRCIQALDYSHRNEDGSVGHIPDSLISEFSTRSGRKVYDGGGIQPDISINQDEAKLLTIGLYSKDIFLDFATRFYYDHDSISRAGDFCIDDDTYSAFIDFVGESDFEYESVASREFGDLLDLAMKDSIYQGNEDLFEEMAGLFEPKLEKDLLNYRDEIARFLASEISGRYYYQWGSIESSIRQDKDIERALELLENIDSYNSVLRP